MFSYPTNDFKGRLHNLICADCGKPMIFRNTLNTVHKSGEAKSWYQCKDFPSCRGALGAHPDGTPLGTPANTETRRWRIEAHSYFDALIEVYRIPKKKAYKWLALEMNMTKEECHIANFGIEQCKNVILYVNNFLNLFNDMEAYESACERAECSTSVNHIEIISNRIKKLESNSNKIDRIQLLFLNRNKF